MLANNFNSSFTEDFESFQDSLEDYTEHEEFIENEEVKTNDSKKKEKNILEKKKNSSKK